MPLPKDYPCTHPIPMNPDSTYNMMIDEATLLADEERIKAEKEYGFTYSKSIGERIYGMVTCISDITPPSLNHPNTALN